MKHYCGKRQMAYDFVKKGTKNPHSPQRGCSGFSCPFFLVSAHFSFASLRVSF